MGLFGKKKKKKKQPQPNVVIMQEVVTRYAQDPPKIRRMWECAPNKGIVKMVPRYNCGMYVYYTAPLVNVVPGRRLMLEAFPGDVVLHSMTTGDRLDTGKKDFIAWMYAGQIIGCCGSRVESVMRKVEEGYRVFADAVCTGWYAPDIQEIEIWVCGGPKDFEPVVL